MAQMPVSSFNLLQCPINYSPSGNSLNLQHNTIGDEISTLQFAANVNSSQYTGNDVLKSLLWKNGQNTVYNFMNDYYSEFIPAQNDFLVPHGEKLSLRQIDNNMRGELKPSLSAPTNFEPIAISSASRQYEITFPRNNVFKVSKNTHNYIKRDYDIQLTYNKIWSVKIKNDRKGIYHIQYLKRLNAIIIYRKGKFHGCYDVGVMKNIKLINSCIHSYKEDYDFLAHFDEYARSPCNVGVNIRANLFHEYGAEMMLGHGLCIGFNDIATEYQGTGLVNLYLMADGRYCLESLQPIHDHIVGVIDSQNKDFVIALKSAHQAYANRIIINKEFSPAESDYYSNYGLISKRVNAKKLNQ